MQENKPKEMKLKKKWMQQTLNLGNKLSEDQSIFGRTAVQRRADGMDQADRGGDRWQTVLQSGDLSRLQNGDTPKWSFPNTTKHVGDRT